MTNNGVPKIAIVGRPNVGKSSLFNRIIGYRKAIVEAARGTTRDRLYASIKWKGKSFTIVDTGGFEAAAGNEISALVLKQLKSAIEEADILLFVTDCTAGVLPQDQELSAFLRKTSKRIYLVVNKADDRSKIDRAVDFFELGLGEPYAVSASLGTGIKELLDDVALRLDGSAVVERADAVKIAIVGRPNVGKSSFLNSILKEERAIVHHVAGTTRDALDTDFSYNGRNYILIDTAGMRHNPKIKEPVDYFGGVRSRETVSRADVAIVLIDGYDGMREDDARIIDLVISQGKGLIIAINKWDLVKGVEMSKYRGMLQEKLKLVRDYPVIFISSKTGKNVISSLDLAWSVNEKMKVMLPTDRLRGILETLNNSIEVRGKGVRFAYLVQKNATPPTFNIGIKSARPVNDSLKKYAERALKASCDLEGVPVKVVFVKMQKTLKDK